jgi:hypothetical protein
MKSIKISQKSTWLWVIGFIAYNTYFGWNKTPLSELETTFDGVFRVWMTFNIVIYLYPLFKRYEKWIEKQELADKIQQERASWRMFDEN